MKHVAAPTLEIIGAGFGRTGTLSLREALVRLGYGPCDHMLENFEHPARFVLWGEAFRRKQARVAIDWRPLLAGYRAIVDWPGAYFRRELTVAHPRAKIILSVRDPRQWYDSTLNTIYTMRARQDDSPWTRAMMRGIGLLVPSMRSGMRIANNVIWDGTFGGRFTDRDRAIRIFDEHNQEVRETIAADRLLVFDVKEGWPPLCAFLGVPVPEDEPFPHVNDAESFRRRIQERFAGMALRATGAALVLAGGLTVVLRLLRRWRAGEERQ